MAKPDLKTEFKEQPTTGVLESDKAGVIANILRQLERGELDSPSRLADFITRDDRVHGVLQTRINGLLGLKLEIKPAEMLNAVPDPDKEITPPDDLASLSILARYDYKSALVLGDAAEERGLVALAESVRARAGELKAKDIAETVEKLWSKVFPSYAISQMLRWGRLIGVAIAEVKWVKRADSWTPLLWPWHPRNLRWDSQTEKYFLYTENKGEIEINPGDGRWVLYTPDGYKEGWMRGLLRPLLTPWLARQWTVRDWARRSEVHGIPIRLAKVPENAPKDKQRTFLRQVAGVGNEAVVMLQTDAEGKSRYGVELVESQSDAHAIFKEFVDWANTAIAITVLGQNLTTEVKGGSFAAAQVHNSIRSDFLKADAETLSETLYEQVLKPWAAFQWGSAELAPWPQWETDPPEDLSVKSKTMLTVMESLGKALEAGAPVDQVATLNAYGIEIREKAEERRDEIAEAPPVAATIAPKPSFDLTPTDIASIVKVNQALASIGLPPLDGPEGNLTITEYKAKNAGSLAKAAAAEAGDTASAEVKPSEPAPLAPKPELDGVAKLKMFSEACLELRQSGADDQVFAYLDMAALLKAQGLPTK